MFRFIVRRFLQTVPVLLAAVTLTFFLIRLAPGGPFVDEKNFSAESIRRLNEHYGLNDPIGVQYVRYIRGALHGDLGPSLHYSNRTVHDIIRDTFPVSLELGCLALLFAVAIGLLAGITASLRPDTALDHTPMAFAMIGICVPSFVLGPLLSLLFGLRLGWVNVSGWETAGDRILPALTLGAAYAAAIARLTRGSMLEVLPRDFIRTARAKGVSELGVILRHALKNGILPVISFLGPATAGLLTGSFVVEVIFRVPGMGQMFVMAAMNRDYTLILGLVVFYGTLVVGLNTVVDILLAWLDPRVRTMEA